MKNIQSCVTGASNLIRHARGVLGSYPIQEIVDRAVQSFQEGVCEIWLTSEDTGAYGRDIGFSLPELLWRLVEVRPALEVIGGEIYFCVARR